MSRAWHLLLLIAFLLGGACSDDDTVTLDSGSDGPAADVAVDATPDATPDGYLPGDLDAAPPGCNPACAKGEVCSAGTCVLPGPTRSCGAGPFPAGLPKAGVVYVNRAHTGASDGTETKPYTSIGAALAAITAAPTPDAGAKANLIAVATGVYDEQIAISSTVELRCRCADKVRIGGPIKIQPAGSDIQVTIDGCEVAPKALPQQPADWGACHTSSKKPCKLDKDCSVPETCDPTTLECVHPGASKDRGVWVKGAKQDAVDLLVRDSVIAGWCSGVYFNADAASSSSMCLSRTRIWGNQHGVEVKNAPPATMLTPSECSGIGEAIASTLSHIDQNAYAGVFTHSLARGVGLRANLVSRSGRLVTPSGTKLAANKGGFGVYLGNTSSARIESNVITDNENVGLGMINSESFSDTTFEIRKNLLTGNKGAGISLQQLQASKPVQIIDNLVGGTLATSGDPGGDGIQVLVAHGTSYAVTVKGNRVQASQRHGLIVDGVSGAVDTNTVQASGGYGLFVQRAPGVVVGSNNYAGNAKGNVKTVTSGIELCSDLPLPIP